VYYSDGTITIQIAGIYGEAFGPACPILAG